VLFRSERLAPGLGEGAWAKSIEAANGLVADLVRPTSEFSRVVAAVSEGDLTQRMDLRLDGRASGQGRVIARVLDPNLPMVLVT
jgi:methyl-accepting chemotaxis protein